MLDINALVDQYLGMVPGKTYIAAAVGLVFAYLAYKQGDYASMKLYIMGALAAVGLRNAIAKAAADSKAASAAFQAKLTAVESEVAATRGVVSSRGA